MESKDLEIEYANRLLDAFGIAANEIFKDAPLSAPEVVNAILNASRLFILNAMVSFGFSETSATTALEIFYTAALKELTEMCGGNSVNN